MTAASLSSTPAGRVDRLVLRAGLALVDWSSRRVARRVRLAAPAGSPALALDAPAQRDRALRYRTLEAHTERARTERLLDGCGISHTLFR